MTQYFVLNTDRKNDPTGNHEKSILEGKYAWLYSQKEKYEDNKQYNIHEDDVFFIYGNERGVIAVGKVKGALVRSMERKGYELKEFILLKSPISVDEIKKISNYSIKRSVSRAFFRIHKRKEARILFENIMKRGRV